MYDDETTTGPTDEASEVEGHKFTSRREDGTDKTDEDVEGHKFSSRREDGTDKPDDDDVEGHRLHHRRG